MDQLIWKGDPSGDLGNLGRLFVLVGNEMGCSLSVNALICGLDSNSRMSKSSYGRLNPSMAIFWTIWKTRNNNLVFNNGEASWENVLELIKEKVATRLKAH
ncbi:uncharacterized protein LOC114266696 [Camellia sinensis]|uniref:uncharacterized protein LOC114266696 n=1 Tax=Camellia sinensis TaxID=4442 RepID=UPI001036C98D|nr:uncharacterized protein LOC114266696 [Camellia sinensis]